MKLPNRSDDSNILQWQKTLSPFMAATILLIFAPVFMLFAGSYSLETLHSFEGSEGAQPSGSLVEGNDGYLYGTTRAGGSNGVGTVFRISTAGDFTTLVSFNGDNGSNPYAGLVLGSNGIFYGTTYRGGADNSGTVFKMTTNHSLTTLVSFYGTFNGGNGLQPSAELLEGIDGNFYGTTQYGGGSNSRGTAFKMTTNGALTTLVFFNPFVNSNGKYPSCRLVQGSDGSFYGTTQEGGTNNLGTVFRLTTNGALTTLVSFKGTNGNKPWSGLLRGSDGHFYGTTAEGGPTGDGTVFRIASNGIFATLASFNGTNGSWPIAGLMEGSDGNFYGTTYYRGASNWGTVFQITPNGNLTTLFSFEGSNGGRPQSRLLLATDGNFYGTTVYGGPHNAGTVFRIVTPVSLNSKKSGDELVLSWSTNSVGYALQEALNLTPPVAWLASTSATFVSGTHFIVTNAFSASARFYRLKKP